MGHITSSEASLIEAFDHYFQVFLTGRNPEASAALATDGITGFGTGRDERVYGLDSALHLYQREVESVPDPIHFTVHRRKATLLDDQYGLVMGEMDWHTQIRQRKVTFFGVRVSLIMTRDGGHWKVVHKHLSQPSTAHGPDEGYPLREIEAESIVLERMVEQRTLELEQAHREMQRLAVTDPLTGLFNRVKIDDVLNLELSRQTRQPDPLSVIMLDIDDFKPINDRYGHRKGDEVLAQFATILTSRSRKTDCLGRWGGEEFLIVCPNTELAAAERLAEDLRRAIASHPFDLDQPLTASLGVAESCFGDTPETLVERADVALYSAKHQGRNRVTGAPLASG